MSLIEHNIFLDNCFDLELQCQNKNFKHNLGSTNNIHYINKYNL